VDESSGQIRVTPVEGDGNELEAGDGYVKGIKAPNSHIEEVSKALKGKKIDVGLVKGNNNKIKVKGKFEVSGVDFN